jgi:hypothetical protein
MLDVGGNNNKYMCHTLRLTDVKKNLTHEEFETHLSLAMDTPMSRH